MSRTSRTPGPGASPFAGRTIAITGGARGIGAATARLLQERGADVIIGDRDAAHLEETARELGVRWHPLDVTSVEDWTAFVAAAGEIDVLVNNAGIMPVGPFLDEDAGVTRQIFEVNTFGVINGTRAVAPGMVARGRGHVVNIASAVGRVALPNGASYSASKHAVVGFTEAMRAELGPSGVEVSMVLPVIVNTALGAGVARTRGVPTLDPEQVAAVVVDVIRRPVPEAWAPRWGQPVTKVSQALPRRFQEVARRLMGADDVLTHADAGVRAAYESEARRT
ncbi:SDR family oxidoreductase [Nocardioides houyundeii]|uniref:SDR family oxidoreductase n=1 Tax=Nocardioides houyundeii TaxID=2045452 RepID=UPI000C78AE2A|nr:SDR family oxidoreductase [Nocardioides houyundeii]